MELSNLRGGVAVLTGSASGIGYEIARKCVSLGMHVALSDVRQSALDDAIMSLRLRGDRNCRIEGFLCDVTSLSNVQNLLFSVQETFKNIPIQFLAANTGVFFTGATLLTGTAEEWEKTYQVNVLGVAYTLRTFVPVMCSQPQKSVIEITASMAACTWGMLGPYGTSKLAALGVAEALWGELNAQPEKPLDRISIVALCPAIVKTDLLESGEEASGGKVKAQRVDASDMASVGNAKLLKDMFKIGMKPEHAVSEIFSHIADGKFYCFVDNDEKRDGMKTQMTDRITDRCNAMLSGDMKIYRTPPATAAPFVHTSSEHTSKL